MSQCDVKRFGDWLANDDDDDDDDDADDDYDDDYDAY